MSPALLAWIALGGAIVLAGVIIFFANIPALRRYLRIRRM